MAPPFLTSAIDGGEWSTSRPSRFPPRERAPGTHWTGGWVGPRAGPDAVEYGQISCLCRKLNLCRPASSYTDWALPIIS
jgi:hypothetical protein